MSRLAAALAIAALLAAGCGHYGPPVRAQEASAAAASGSEGEAEECDGCERKETP